MRYNKVFCYMTGENPVIDFNFGRHKDLSTLKSDIHLELAASMNYQLFG